jgi:epsin
MSEEDDVEYRLAIEASKHQEEEDRRKRESRNIEDDDDDLAKAIKLSKEEEERRRRELEDSNASSLFDTQPVQVAQPTGYNQGYQQGSAVDFFANPIDMNQMQQQQTAFMGAAYTGFQAQPMGYPNGFTNGFGVQPTGFDPYGQQQQFQSQPTGFNPYAQQLAQSPIQQEPIQQPGSNNPWATGNASQMSPLRPAQTGSNNPFAQPTFNSRPQTTFKTPTMSTLSSLPEQKTLSSFNTQPSFTPSQPAMPAPPQKELSEHEAKLNALLASGDGMDTFGNTGNLRIPAQHTAPGTFVNSAGAGLHKLTADATGNNPFLRQQFTGMPTVSYGGMNGGFGGQPANNPFNGQRPQQQQTNQGDLIQF